MISEPVTVALTPSQRSMLAGYGAQINALESLQQTAVEAILAGTMELEDIHNCHADLTDAGIVVRPKVVA